MASVGVEVSTMRRAYVTRRLQAFTRATLNDIA